MTDILKIKQNNQWVSIPAIKGDPGEGVIAGGTTGQVLKKKTNTDYDTEWGTVDALPSQSGQSGKYLTTNGSSASWAEISQPTKISDLTDDTATYPIDKADKATQDASGNVITTTYATKSELYHPPLLSATWSDHLLEDISWLRADTFSWQNGTTYALAYNELLTEYNNASSTTETEEIPWTQPTLSDNGTMGGNSFAVSCSSYHSARQAYKSFDGNSATKWGVDNTATGWLTFYNPQQLKVSNIKYTPSTDYPHEDGGDITISGSNDNSTWTSLWTGTYSANTVTNFNVNSSSYYNYYKIEITNGISNWVGLGDLTITATLQGITYKRTPKGYKIADASQETSILNKYTSDGIAWYYILDTANTRFKLPRTKFGFEGLRTNVGDDIAESLPNIKAGKITIQDWAVQETQVTGAWGGSVAINNNNVASGTTANEYTINFDASRSSSTYQDNAPVQERATQMYLYFYVGEYSQTAIEQTAGITSEQLNAKMDLSLLSVIYPVGSIYIGTQATCPMAALITGSTWELVSDGRVLQGSDSTHQAGTTIAAGLPNITGGMAYNHMWDSDPSLWGAFYRVWDGGWRGSVGGGSNNFEGYTAFDASRSSSIYGNSSTVQPPAYVVNIWRRTA